MVAPARIPTPIATPTGRYRWEQSYTCYYCQYTYPNSKCPTNRLCPMSSRITHRLRVSSDVGIRIKPFKVTLRGIRREEHSRHRIVIPRVIIIQPRYIPILPSIALRCPHRPLTIALVPIGTIELIAQHYSASHRRTKRRQDTAEQIRQEELRISVLCPLQPQSVGLPAYSSTHCSCWFLYCHKHALPGQRHRW